MRERRPAAGLCPLFVTLCGVAVGPYAEAAPAGAIAPAAAAVSASPTGGGAARLLVLIPPIISGPRITAAENLSGQTITRAQAAAPLARAAHLIGSP